jgi:serine protease
MSVAAVDNTLTHADFSQRNVAVDIAAPGVAIASTMPRGTDVGGVPSDYGSISGTSMASPHVAGVAALVWSNAPQCSSTEIGAALKASALDLGTPGWDYKYGSGEVRAKAALEYINAKGCTGQIGSGKF